jgi:hypothetical protein
VNSPDLVAFYCLLQSWPDLKYYATKSQSDFDTLCRFFIDLSSSQLFLFLYKKAPTAFAHGKAKAMSRE